jgi:hypothetical protein
MFKCVNFSVKRSVNFKQLVLFGSLDAYFQTMRNYLIAMVEESSILRSLFLDAFDRKYFFDDNDNNIYFFLKNQLVAIRTN